MNQNQNNEGDAIDVISTNKTHKTTSENKSHKVLIGVNENPNFQRNTTLLQRHNQQRLQREASDSKLNRQSTKSQKRVSFAVSDNHKHGRQSTRRSLRNLQMSRDHMKEVLMKNVYQ